MTQRLFAFARGLSATRIGATGVALVTSSFFLFVGMELLRALGIVTNAYVGLLSYLILPGFFVVGLLLIPLGWWTLRRRTGKTTSELLSAQFSSAWLASHPAGSRIIAWIAGLTAVNLVFLTAGSFRMLRFMDEPSFCGTACHSVMSPEWTAYQDSSHAHVPCVRCHVGDEPEAVVDAKMNGLRQMASVLFDLHERPIPTPVHNMRPARETCETCHWPNRHLGHRVKTLTSYGMDRNSTPSYTTLSMLVGVGEATGVGDVHWHAGSSRAMRYAAADRQRKRIAWVEVQQGDGSWRRFENRSVQQPNVEGIREFDCMDCHNRTAHIFEAPARAIDWRLERGLLDQDLPYVRRAALGALLGSYTDTRSALDGIEDDFRGFYARDELGVLPTDPRVDAGVAVIQQAYSRNIHADMGIDWDTYPDHLGHHKPNGGCFRCHQPDMVDESGAQVSSDCTLCHAILAYDSPTPFEFVGAEKDGEERKGLMAPYLREAFKTSRQAAAQPPLED